MNGRCTSLVIVCLVSVFLHFPAAGHFWTSVRNSSFCFWTRSLSNGRTHYMFLHQITMGNERSFVIFDSTWNDENSLVDCITSNNQAATKSFSSKCQKARDGPFSDIPDGRFNISMLVEPDGPCVVVGQLPELSVPLRRTRDLEIMDRKTISWNSGEGSQKLKRSKRAWMIPGTLWCGSGNKASDFSDLGLFEETDKCCREHDHCAQTLASFEFAYGIFNTNLFTLSHCNCDRKFHRCLHNVNDHMSNMVGYGYFNVLKMQCFEFSQRMKCAKRTWWGMCKHSQMTTYALLRDATDYNSTFPTMEDDKLDLSIHHAVSFGDLTVTNDLAVSSDIVTEDGSQKHSSVSLPQRLSFTVNTSQQPEPHKQTESLKTHATDSSKIETTDSTKTEITDSLKTETTDLTKTETYSPKTQTTDSQHITDSEQTADSPHIDTTDSRKTQTVSQQRQTNLPKTEATDSSNAQTDSPHIMDSEQTTDSQQRQKDSPKIPTTDSPKTRATDSEQTDSPDINTTDSQQRQKDSPMIPTTDSPKTRATDSEQTDSPDINTTDSQQRQKDSPKTQTTNLPSTQTDSPHITDSEQTDSPHINTTDSSKTQTDSQQRQKDLPKTQATNSPKIQTTDSPHITDSEQTTDSPKTPTDSPKMHIHPEMYTRQKGKLDTCESYKDLDSCLYQIPAQQEKFGLRNAEHTTLYHCNCTARLAEELAEHGEVDKVHFWLLDIVSQFCFFLPQNCTESESCSASPHDARFIQSWNKSAAVWRHLAATRRKVKRLNLRRSKRKDFPVRLYRKCVRMQSKLQNLSKTHKRRLNAETAIV